MSILKRSVRGVLGRMGYQLIHNRLRAALDKDRSERDGYKTVCETVSAALKRCQQDRDGYKNAYEEVTRDLGQCRQDRDGYKNAYEEVSRELGQCRQDRDAYKSVYDCAQNFERRFQEQQNALTAKIAEAYHADYYYFIDVVGNCNLRCPSCPVGNSLGNAPAKGLMKLQTFVEIVAKIRQERAGKTVFIDLYNWGEALFHPDIDKVIHVCLDHQVGCGISTNLNHVPNLEKAILARPTYLRISLSGSLNSSYAVTHRRGDVNKVKSNMFLLRHLLDKHQSSVLVQVGYHLYKHNTGEEFTMMKRLCWELGFLLLPQIAIFQPAETTVKMANGKVEQASQPLHDLLLITPQEWKADLASARGQHSDCAHRKFRTSINADGSVPLCCAVYDPALNVADNFLQVPHDELQKRRYQHAFCKACEKQNVDMMFTGVQTERSQGILQQILHQT